MGLVLECVETIASTSDALRQRAEGGAGEVALLAGEQTGGRGRLGRTWHSPRGNMHLSVLLRPQGPFVPGHWSLLTAVALAEAMDAVLPGMARLKWPNDVLLSGGKVAGILLEAGGDPAWLVIGFGVNLVAAPTGLGRATACVADYVAPPEPQVFARSLLERLADLRTLYAEAGFAPIRTAWLARGPALGNEVTVRGGERRIEGRFAGLDTDGAMLLDGPAGRVTVTAGEVA